MDNNNFRSGVLASKFTMMTCLLCAITDPMSLKGIILIFLLSFLFLMMPAFILLLFLILGWSLSLFAIGLGVVMTVASLLLSPLLLVNAWMVFGAISGAIAFATFGFLMLMVMFYFTLLYFKFMKSSLRGIYDYARKA
ncbi:MAG: hypothetical protein ACLGGX_01605 [Bdellovibrionia bacterium]